MWSHARKFREIDLHGMIVDDAIIRVSEAITDAVKKREIRIRINHGKGTGTLRHEIRAMLRAHPAVQGLPPRIAEYRRRRRDGSGPQSLVAQA